MAKIRNLEVAGYADMPGPGLLDVKRYGAKGDNSNNDTVPINAALLAAQTNGNGGVFFPPGTYRLFGAIVGQPYVSMYGVPGRTTFIMDHATADMIRFSNGPLDTTSIYIRGITFLGGQDNTGACFNLSTGEQRIIIENCAFNGGGSPWHLIGSFLWLQGSNPSHVNVRDCYLRTAGNSAPFISNLIITGNVNANTHWDNNYIVMGDNSNGSMLPLSKGRNKFTNNYFDLTEHVSGPGSGGACFFVFGGLPHPQTINNNTYYTPGGPTVYSLAAEAGAWVLSSDNTYTGSVTRMNTAFLDIQSKVDMVPISFGATGGTSMTLPDNVECFSASFSSTAPTLTMPTKIFPGQEMTVTIRNFGPGAWGGIGMIGLNAPLLAGGGVAGSQAVTFKAKVVCLRADNSTWVWAMISQFTISFTTT